MSACEECQSSLGCLVTGTKCNECDKLLCSKCSGENALIRFNPDDDSTIDISNKIVTTYCKQCFQKVSTIDFSKTFDIIEPLSSPSPSSSNNDNETTIAKAKATFIMTHGGGGTRNMLLPHARELSKLGYRSILVDLPGHGSMVDTPLTLDNCVETIEKIIKDTDNDFCDHRCTKTIIYVGASLGGYVGFYILDKLSNYFSGGILIDVGQNVGPDCSYMANVGLWFMKQMGNMMSNEQLLKSMISIASKNSNVDYHLIEAVYGSGMYFQQSSNQVECLHTVSPANHIPKYKFPILFMNGSEDHRDSEDLWLSLICQDYKKQSSLKVYDGGDHFFIHDSRFINDILDRTNQFATNIALP